MRKAILWFLTSVSVISIAACKRGIITYQTNGIVLENYDNCGNFIVPASGPVGDSCYVIRVNYKSDQTAFNGVNDQNTYEPGNIPTGIFIYSLQQFDSLHPAGTSLNEFFIAGPGTGSVAEDIVNDFANTQDFYPTHDPDDLWLMKSPANIGIYSFVVRLEFNDGVIASDTTTVNLN